MIYTSVLHKSNTRVVETTRVRDWPMRNVVLNGIIEDGRYVKTGPYCPIRYDIPAKGKMLTAIAPASGVSRYVDYRDRGKRR